MLVAGEVVEAALHVGQHAAFMLHEHHGIVLAVT